MENTETAKAVEYVMAALRAATISATVEAHCQELLKLKCPCTAAHCPMGRIQIAAQGFIDVLRQLEAENASGVAATNDALAKAGFPTVTS